MRISDWSSDVCSSDLLATPVPAAVTKCSRGSRSAAPNARREPEHPVPRARPHRSLRRLVLVRSTRERAGRPLVAEPADRQLSGSSPPRPGRRAPNSRKAPLRKVGPFCMFTWWRGLDLNQRPSGYEPEDQHPIPYNPVPCSGAEQDFLGNVEPVCHLLYHGIPGRGVEEGVEDRR